MVEGLVKYNFLEYNQFCFLTIRLILDIVLLSLDLFLSDLAWDAIGLQRISAVVDDPY